MSSRRTLILIAAIAVGVFAGLALLNYVRGIEDDVYADAQPVEVLIAKADIPEGTTAADALESVEITEIPLSIRPATFLAPGNEAAISGLVALTEIPANQIIVNGLFVDPTVIAASFTDQIPSGQVAISVSVAQVRAVGGYLQPGDEVNILVNHDALACGREADPTTGATDPVPVDVTEALTEEGYCTYAAPARYLFQRVEILAIGARQTLQPGETGENVISPQGGTITFMVPSEAAQLIASVQSESIYLTLLPDDYEAEPLPAMTFDLMDGPTPAEIPSCLTPYGADGFIEGDLSTAVADGADGPNDHFSCITLWGG